MLNTVSSGEFCTCPEELFGAPIPVTSVVMSEAASVPCWCQVLFPQVADQQSAMFAQCCWSPGDIKVTLGTGMFFDVNTGNKPHASITGLTTL